MCVPVMIQPGTIPRQYKSSHGPASAGMTSRIVSTQLRPPTASTAEISSTIISTFSMRSPLSSSTTNG
ncbi:MAG TPA: hypothetical protein VN048_05170 [Verrucomicrobiae bacterium]|nr:hypothetical protein [Verrucomicrobiae bacterium]